MTIALTGLAIVVVAVLVTLVCIYIVRHWIPEDVKGQASDSWAIFAFCGVLYALVVGFVLSYALSGYQNSNADVGAEANSVTGLSRVATLYAADDRDQIGHELICYARAVIDDEWPRMTEGERSELATAATDRLIRSVGGLDRTSPNDAALVSSLDRVRELSETRAARLQASTDNLPLMFWLFMIIGGLILCLYATVLAGRERPFGQFIYILPVALLLLSSMYLVASFERPFGGPNAIEPTAMESSLESVVGFIPDPRADRPCP
ncbi:MAG: hypothetical protein WD181_02810 [Solirubrobacterales bacterium]